MSVSTSNNLSAQAPTNARISAQEAQIAELVKQVQDFERVIHELRKEVTSEKERGLEAAKQIRDKWRIESQQWHDGYEFVQERHRLATLGVHLLLENERSLLLENKEVLLQEKTARLVKEYEFTLLQTKQTKLLSQIGTLEDEVDAQREELAQILIQHESEVSSFKTKLDLAESRLQERMQEIKALIEDKHKKENEISELKSSTSSSTKQVDRLSLQVDSLRTQNAILETRNKELQHQIDKWQTLEGKGEKEMEEHRKRRAELEVRIKELEFEVERMRKDARGAQRKVSQLEIALLEAQEQVEQTMQDLTLARSETIDAAKNAAKWEQQVERLKTTLETERVRTAEFQKRESERLRLDRATSLLAEGTTSEQQKKKWDVRQAKERAEEAVLQKEVPSEGLNGPEIVSSDPDDAVQSERKGPNRKPRPKRKTKAVIRNSNDDEQPIKRAGVEQKQIETDMEDEQAVKKKRRKINVKSAGVFANAPGFSFAQTGDGILDIPSVLSPVKEGEVPPRLGTLGSMMRF